jgi:hypothetical protein
MYEHYHVAPHMEFMASELREKRVPANPSSWRRLDKKITRDAQFF